MIDIYNKLRQYHSRYLALVIFDIGGATCEPTGHARFGIAHKRTVVKMQKKIYKFDECTFEEIFLV